MTLKFILKKLFVSALFGIGGFCVAVLFFYLIYPKGDTYGVFFFVAGLWSCIFGCFIATAVLIGDVIEHFVRRKSK